MFMGKVFNMPGLEPATTTAASGRSHRAILKHSIMVIPRKKKLLIQQTS